MKVIFAYEKEGSLIIYPDDIGYFSNTDDETSPGYIIADYTGVLSLTEYTVVTEKSVYTNADFMAKIPAKKWAKIQGHCTPPTPVDPENLTPDEILDETASENINLWCTMITMEAVINLNELKAWFVPGLDGMIHYGDLNQTQVDNFLEI